jgi:hypothetical protein
MKERPDGRKKKEQHDFLSLSLSLSLSLGPTKLCFDHFVSEKKVLFCEPSGFLIP